ncbi:MAG: hypothetical protein PVH19_11475, partial [Planctomycetia bacterium]
MFIKKRWIALAGCLAALALFAPALASPEPPTETPEEAALHEGLRQLKTVFEDAANNNDIEKLRPYIAPEFSVVTFTDSSFD